MRPGLRLPSSWSLHKASWQNRNLKGEEVLRDGSETESFRMDRTTFNQVLTVLTRLHPVEDWSRGMSPFEVLVSVVVSQNTTVANERRAMGRLRDRVGVDSQAIAKAELSDLEDALRPAGLFRSKARSLKSIAQYLSRGGGSDLSTILRLPTEEARRRLTSLPGVGPKTADVVLSMAGDHPTFPVDTHVWRIAKRWELSEAKSYEEVRESLESRVPPDQRRTAHLVLIRFGRETCKAVRPRCPICPVSRQCPWYAKVRSGEIRARLYEP